MHSLRSRLRLLAWLLPAMMAIAGCQGVGPAGTPIERTEPEKTASQQLDEQGGPLSERKLVGNFGGQLLFRHLKLTIPSGAISTDVYVEVRLAPEAPEGFVRESAYLLTPNDLVLLKPALLALHYYDDDLAADESEEDITIVQEMNGRWMPLAGVSLDTYNNIASAQITRFATYALQVSPPRAPLMNIPPVAKLTYKLLAPGEEAAAAEAGEAGVPPEEGAGAETPSEEAAAPSEEAGEVPPEAPPAEKPPVEALPKPPGMQEGQDALSLEAVGSNGEPVKAEPARRGKGEAPSSPGKPPGGEAVAPKAAPPAGSKEAVPPERLVEPPAEPGEKGFLVEKEAPSEKAVPEPGYTVEYSAADSTDEDGNIAAYCWDMDADGVIDDLSSQPDLTHRYDTYGSGLTILRVEDDQEPVGSDLTWAAVELPRSPVDPTMPLTVRAAAYPAEQQIGGKVVAGASVFGGTPPYTFDWKFPDGSTSDKQAVLLSFDRAGKRTFRLTVRDAEGVEVHREAAAKIVRASEMAEGRIRLRLKPMSVSLDHPGEADFSLEVKNGQPPYRLAIDTGVGEPTIAGLTDFSVRFDNAGYYILTVLLTDAQGRSGKAFVPVAVAVGEEADAGVQPTLGRLSFEPKFARDGLEVTFTPRELPRGASVSWDFGDGTRLEAERPKKRYAKSGTYRVTMSADDGFRLFQRERVIPVGGGGLAAAIDQPGTLYGTAPFAVRPRAIVSGGVVPLFYRWRLGDLFSEGERPHFTIDEPGEYQLELTVSDGKGIFFDTEPVKVEVFRAPLAYRYPIAFVQENEQTGALQVKLTEFDGGARAEFPPFVSAPQEVQLAPGGKLLAVFSARGFHLYEVGKGAETFGFSPSRGSVVSLSLSASAETFAFNLETGLGARGYLYQKESGIVPVGGDGERVLDLTPDGRALLTLDREGVSRLYRLDPFIGGVGKPFVVMKGATEGRLLGDASSAVILGSDNQVYRVAISSGERAQLTADPSPKFNLAVSLSGSVVAYNLEGGEVVVAQSSVSGDDAPPFPLNVSRLNGFAPTRWSLSPDGKLLVGYGSVAESEGLFIVDLTYDLEKATAEELAPHFLVASTPQFAIGASLKPFDQLLGLQEEGAAPESPAPE